MSHKPNPVALTAAMLMRRHCGQYPLYDPPFDHHIQTVADVASKLHRMAPAFTRYAVALCNGEQYEGQRDKAYEASKRSMYPVANEKAIIAEMEAAIGKEGQRLERKLAKVNEFLAPFSVQACDGDDPRGCTLWLEASPNTQPLPDNGYHDGRWSIT